MYERYSQYWPALGSRVLEIEVIRLDFKPLQMFACSYESDGSGLKILGYWSPAFSWIEELE
jgi:hypothetical protein